MLLIGGNYRAPYAITGFIGALIAIFCEKKERRRELALYMVNITSDVIFRMLQRRGYVTPIKYGETIIFALSLAVLSWVAQTHHDALGVLKIGSKAVYGDPRAPDQVEKPLAQLLGTQLSFVLQE
jgi:hypothetical protein